MIVSIFINAFCLLENVSKMAQKIILDRPKTGLENLALTKKFLKVFLAFWTSKVLRF